MAYHLFKRKEVLDVEDISPEALLAEVCVPLDDQMPQRPSSQMLQYVRVEQQHGYKRWCQSSSKTATARNVISNDTRSTGSCDGARGVLLGSDFSPENEGVMFLRNIGTKLLVHTTS